MIAQAEAASLPLADVSVDLVVTSPPYWRLRRYSDSGGHLPGQIGLEATWQEYISSLLSCTVEFLRVLKPGGSLFVNLGDRYDKNGNLIGIPWRFAFACEDIGLVRRAEIIWYKRNSQPEPVRSRVRRSHEHFFHLTRPGNYYADLDIIRVPHIMRPQRRPNGRRTDRTNRPISRQGWSTAARDVPAADGNPLGKIPGSVWDVPTDGLHLPRALDREGHPPPFPPALVRPVILGWSPPGGTVLDPFGGTGTTGLVASLCGRNAVSLDLSSANCRIARWRSQDPTQQARAT